MNTNPNDPAFSKAAFYHPDGGADSPQSGLSIREYFAAKAMVGIISNAPSGNLGNSKEGVQLAVQWADDLIIELNK